MKHRRRALGAAAWCLWVASPLAAAATLTVGPASGLDLPAALARARDGDVIELPAGHYHGQVGVITQQRLTLRGVGGQPVLHAAGRSAEGKAILVVRGGDVRIENIAFRGARVPDRNGAGIRFERGRLHVQACSFVDNENGLLTANFEDAELHIEDSVFGAAPPGTPLPHLLYVGHIARLTVLRSRFSGGFDGHLLKSRARVTELRDSRLVDGPGGRAAYEVEFPNGGQVTATGNTIGQSARTSNTVIVSYGAEGYGPGPHRLVFSDNTVHNEAAGGIFLRVRAGPPVLEQRVLNNRLIGPGDPGAVNTAHPQRGDAGGNTHTPL